MSSDHFSKVRELFAEALEQPASEREAFVRAHASDPEIATEVLRLMGLDEQPQIHTLQGVQAMADAEAAPLAQGRRVGKFELFEVLGEGGMGQVYRARRVDGPEHWVAVKLMRRGLFNAASETRFLAEQQFLARLNHPNIAHYIDSGSDADGHVYVAMELVQGQRLLDFAKAKELNAKQRVTLFRQLLAAVSYAHRQLIIHRDLKQANVLVTADGVVKLLDFGIAKLLQDQSQMTGTIERLYTPTCAAPEQIRGEPCDVTTDVYALGVLLYELIAGKSIFDTEGKTPGEFENLVLNVPPPDMKSRVHPDLGCTDIPTDLERIVAKAIRKEPNRRYGSVEQFDADLERLLNNEPVSVSGNGFLYRAQKFLSRNKLASGLTALIAIAVLSGLVITLQQNREIRAERDRANLALDAMKQAFLGADPGGEAGGEVSARQILERSIEALAPIASSDDRMFVDLAKIILEVQLSMGLVDEATNTYEMIGNKAYQSDGTLCLLSTRILTERRLLDEAQTRLNECALLPQSDPILSKTVAARLAEKQHNYQAAAQLYKLIQSMVPATEPAWIFAADQQCWMLALAGETDDALNAFQQALQQAEASLPPDHISISRLQAAKLQILNQAGLTNELAELGPKITDELREKLGPRSLLATRYESLVANALAKKGQFPEAIEYYRRAYEVTRNTLGPEHRDTLRAEFNIALTQVRAGRSIQELMPSFESMLVRSDTPKSRPFHQFLKVSYGTFLARENQILQALRIYATVDPTELDGVSFEDKQRLITWLNYAYWKHHCAEDPSEAYTPSNACLSPPKFDSTCLSARTILCGGGLNPLDIDIRIPAKTP